MNVMARSLQSRRVLCNLGEMEDISPRSRQDLESNKHHGEISTRSHQSRRDLADLSVKNFLRASRRFFLGSVKRTPSLMKTLHTELSAFYTFQGLKNIFTFLVLVAFDRIIVHKLSHIPFSAFQAPSYSQKMVIH